MDNRRIKDLKERESFKMKISGLLKKKDFSTRNDLPEWLLTAYQDFHSTVTNPAFPCYFGMAAELGGELRYAFITQKDWSNLPQSLKSFLTFFREAADKRFALFVFIEPFKEEGSLADYRKQFWEVLQYLHEADEISWPDHAPREPDHYLWDFHFHGEPLFVIGNAPAFKQRKSRNLGEAMVIGFQPRRIFEKLDRLEKGRSISREKVRERLLEWDQFPVHPDISHFGDPLHREWKRFFITDDTKSTTSRCPFRHQEDK